LILDFLHNVDEYGGTNYKTRYLAIIGMIFLYIIIALGAVLLQHFESDNPTANIITYGEAFWVLIMASSTIGLMLYKNFVGSKNGRTKMV
jgi:isocitrate dehydrogenase kinase/phosphatase